MACEMGKRVDGDKGLGMGLGMGMGMDTGMGMGMDTGNINFIHTGMEHICGKEFLCIW